MNILEWLALSALLTGLMWVPYVLDRFIKVGVLKSISNLADEDLTVQSAWAKRARRAHQNMVENLVVFGALVLVAVQAGADSLLLSAAGAVFFIGRAAHFVLYAAGVPVLRTVAFLVGFGGQMMVAYVVMS